MTAMQKLYAKKAEKLVEESAETIEKTKVGHSGKAAEMITIANEYRLKAGLITGKMQR